jgi:CRISPR/Cas system-associated protein Cas10 (large subunit of type III CRISPR-Cas system)
MLGDLITHTTKSILSAYSNQSNLPEDVLNIEGMSGNKTRHLYNNICNLNNATYLEIGTWKGSSFISAMYNNTTTKGYCVDNWVEFGGPKNEFYNNINKFLSTKSNKIIIDKNCWEITKDDIVDTIDIFLYDGHHSYESQKKAITYYHNFFSKYVIIMVDDWTCDWVDVKKGTLDGINEMKMKIHFSYEIPLVNTSQHHCGGDTFWNGCGIFICEKTV